MAFEPQRAQDVVYVFSPKKQGSFNTALVDASFTQRLIANNVEFGKITRAARSDAEHFGKGHEWATTYEEVMRDLRRATSFELNTWLAGLIAAFGMGSCTSELVGSSSAYQHTCKFQSPATSKLVNVTSIYEELSADLKRKLIGMAVNDFTISGRGVDPLSIVANWIGSGEIDAVALASVPEPASVTLLYNRDSKIYLGTEGNPTDIAERVLEWAVTITQNLEDELGYYPGSGKYRGRLWFARRQVSASLVVHMKETDDIFSLFDSPATKELKISCQGALIEETYYHKLDIRLPAVRITALDDGVQGNHLLWRVDFGPEGVSKGTTLEEPAQIEVTNTETGYMTAEA